MLGSEKASEVLLPQCLLYNPTKGYGWGSLKLLCRIYHELYHSKRSEGLRFDALGDIVVIKR